MSKEDPTFFGAGYNEERDKVRLTKSLQTLYDVMAAEQWWTLKQLSQLCGVGEASISAHIRSLRRPENGGYYIEREHVENGLHKYRLDHALPTNYEPKGKPKDIIKLEDEHKKMKEAINLIYTSCPSINIANICENVLRDVR